MKRTLHLAVLLLLVVTIGFGFVKQLKHFSKLRADAVLSVPPGSQYAPLKAKLEYVRPDAAELRIAYRSDRKPRPGKRAPVEFFYDAQYAMAPYILAYSFGSGECVMFDNENQRPSLLCSNP